MFTFSDCFFSIIFFFVIPMHCLHICTSSWGSTRS
uniref:Uncharacterized protein n=1 Tax=Anguilla anguilla TaxID=7936 RepID=A0A0E9R889_ANGAN